MIIFEFDEDTNDEGRVVYWLGTTDCTGDDEQHKSEIYEQLDAEQAGLA